MTIARVLDHRLVVCVGTGGVGKTTVAAAVALGAALQGRRAIVLAIDPARALARALGLEALATGGQPIPLSAIAPTTGSLAAAMLDQKPAWDAFVTRHAPTAEVARALLANPFYERLSTSFAGSTEYMAIEEMCQLAESGRHDLVVLDTPPSAYALEFLRAPDRIDRLLDEHSAMNLALRSTTSFVRIVLRQVERAIGSATLRELAAFVDALTALVAGVRARTRHARELLRGNAAAFVLVTNPRATILDDTLALAASLRAHAAPLAAVVVNRTHRQLGGDISIVGDDPAGTWLRTRWAAATAEAEAEAAVLDPFLASLPAELARATIPEGSHDLHSLADLAAVARRLTG
jgi:anion-transporting  ArsA/GET3 family ATPase